jgi:hypothetical protein
VSERVLRGCNYCGDPDEWDFQGYCGTCKERRSEAMASAIHRWHASDTDAELHQWLGLTWEQYAAWVERGTLPYGYELPVRALKCADKSAQKKCVA